MDRVAFIITLGEEMIAVGRYDRTENDHAEVSFLIEDAHQGRGIAQLLLEHLAQAARERGITRFVAEVLRRTTDGQGVCRRRLPRVQGHGRWRPCCRVLDLAHRHFGRRHGAPGASRRKRLGPAAASPQRIVVYGQGDRVQELINSILRGGFGGEVVAVSVDGAPVAGVPNAASIAAAGRLDLAIVSVATNQLGAVVIDAAHKGAPAWWS